MAIIRHVVEYTRAPVVGGVIKGVKVVGLKSRNGYTYSVESLAEAIPLYEDAPVYVLHPDSREKRRGSRQLDAHFGALKSVRLRDDGLYADLHAKQSHPMAGAILESDGRQFGLSHNVHVAMNDDETEVTKIISVNSVDLVDNPATTTNLFESEDTMELAELVAAHEAQAAEIKALTEGQGKILALLESLQTKEPKPAKPKRIAVLEEADDDPDAPAPIGNTHDDFLATVRGFALTN